MTSMVQLSGLHDPLRFTSSGIIGRDATQQPASSEVLQTHESLWPKTIWGPPLRDPSRAVVGQGRTLTKTTADESRSDSRITERTRSRSGDSTAESNAVQRPAPDKATTTDENDQKRSPAQFERSRKSSSDTRSSTSREGLFNTSDLVSGSTADGEERESRYEPRRGNVANSSQVLSRWSTVAPFKPSQLAPPRFDSQNHRFGSYGLSPQTSASHQVHETFNVYHNPLSNHQFGQPISTNNAFNPVQLQNPSYVPNPDSIIYTGQQNANFAQGRFGPQNEMLAGNFARLNLDFSSDPFYVKPSRTRRRHDGGHNHVPQSNILQRFDGVELEVSQNEYRPAVTELIDPDQPIYNPRQYFGDSQGTSQAADPFHHEASDAYISNYAPSAIKAAPTIFGPQNGNADRSTYRARNYNERNTNRPWEASNTYSAHNNIPSQYQPTLSAPKTGHELSHEGGQGSLSTFGHSYDLGHAPISPEGPFYRSPLLEDYRTNYKTKRYELKEIYNHIVEFSGDQHGSRFIQHKLEIATSDEKERVFSEIQRECRQLMTDVFGNYVIQKMFEHGSQTQKKALADQMRGQVFNLSMQMYGCRVVQKALEHILTEQQALLIKELDGQVLKVVGDQNGNHVIQKAIERIPGEHIQFIVDAHRGHVHELSKHTYGCRVIQRMLEHCRPQAKRQILDELHVNIGDLIQDAFGNYVVQHVIVNGEPRDRQPVIEKVLSRLTENARHKFASNVVEKAIDYAENDQRQILLGRLISTDELGQSQVRELLSHQYGNYVIQKCAAYLQGPALQLVVGEMEQHLLQLRRISSGKQVTALENTIREARHRCSPLQAYDRHIPQVYHPLPSPSYS